MGESHMFSVKINGEYYTQNTENQTFKLKLLQKKDPMGACVQHFEVKNITDSPLYIDEVISLSIPVTDELMLHYFENRWGHEFVPKQARVSDSFNIKSELGRSSAQFQTLFYIECVDEIKLFQLGWSGNWRAWTESIDGETRLNIGLEADFFTTLQRNEIFTSFPVYTATGTDLNEAGNQLSEYGDKYVFPKNPYENQPLVSWNHWWAYEDKQINEEIFLANLERASQLGIDLMVLDAGWFGLRGDDWFEERGDWEHVNKVKFPSGIRYLSDQVHAKGMKFGLWCEVEALGKLAGLRSKEPNFAATYDEEDLSYVCFGNREAVEWAFKTLDQLIQDYNCDWIKLDFNLDPKQGCNCTMHGHGKSDGLYAHYRGLYEVLQRLRTKFPQILIENCASGGLRTDWGMLKETHLQFLSDPDYAPHQLQVFWAASLSLPPLRCLHFAWSDTLEYEPFPPKKWNECNEAAIRAYLRVAGMHRFGLSHRLPEWDTRTMNIVAEGIKEYKEKIFSRLSEAQVYRLFPQHNREKAGRDAFQFVKSDQEIMIFLFDFDKQDFSNFEMTKPLSRIDEKGRYECEWLSAGEKEILTGEELLSGDWYRRVEVCVSEVLIINKK